MEVAEVEAKENFRSTDDVVTAGLVAFGLYLVGISLFAAVAPGAFFDTVGPYGERSDHYIHDVAAFQGAVGVFVLLAVRRPAWRIPALLVATLQFGLHALSHLADIRDADPEWVGLSEFIALAAATAVLVWLLARANRAAKAQ
jgi:hypothetical protein